MKILIVDDAIEKCKIIQRILKKNLPYDVDIAHSAEAGFSLLGFDAQGQVSQPSHYKIILMDVVMPGMNGIDATRFLKGNPVYEDTPVLMITGDNDEATIDSAFRAGAMDYITTTPIRELELLARVNSAIRLHNEMERRKKREAELIETTKILNQTNQILEKISTHDPLTNLYNRRYFDQYLEAEWENVSISHQTLSLVMVDVDYFKPYNDHYGHQDGDQVLRLVADALSHCATRSRDVVARYGGEEFAMILPNTDFQGAGFIANAVCLKIRELEIPHIRSPHDQYITVSAGYASVRFQDWADLQKTDLIARADKALYEAKSRGRNQAVAYEV